MGSQEEYKTARRAKTREAAVALVDDMEFLRTVLANDAPTAGDIRRMSAQLRRILVDAAIDKIAAPRVGKITFQAPAIDQIVRSNRATPYAFLHVGPATIFGVRMAMGAIDRAGTARAAINYNPDGTTQLDLEHFMSQGVIVFEGDWISRREVVKFIANVAEGVHSGENKDDRDRLIARARHAIKFSVENGTPTFVANTRVAALASLPPLLSKTALDPVLIELWAAAEMLVQSPDVQALEAYINAE